MYIFIIEAFQARSPLQNPFTIPIRFYITHEAPNCMTKSCEKDTHWSNTERKSHFLFAHRSFFGFTFFVCLCRLRVLYLIQVKDIEIMLTVSCKLSEKVRKLKWNFHTKKCNVSIPSVWQKKTSFSRAFEKFSKKRNISSKRVAKKKITANILAICCVSQLNMQTPTNNLYTHNQRELNMLVGKCALNANRQYIQ